MNLKSKIILI